MATGPVDVVSFWRWKTKDMAMGFKTDERTNKVDVFQPTFEDLGGFVALLHKIVTRRMADKALIQFDLSVNEAEYINHQPNRRRHTQHQIQVLEAFFRDCPNPDYKQRRALGHELGLEPQQVKFWFQNKRTQLKMQYGHLENAELRAENRRLKDENMSHMEHLENAVCLSCGSPLVIPEISVDEHQLRAENERLREEIDRLSALAAPYIGEPVTDSDNIPHRTAP